VSPLDIVEAANRAEAMGFASLWTYERLLFPRPPQLPDRGQPVIAQGHEGAVHDGDLIAASAPERRQGQQRSQGINHPMRRGV
jgi:hypothetical protein